MRRDASFDMSLLKFNEGNVLQSPSDIGPSMLKSVDIDVDVVDVVDVAGVVDVVDVGDGDGVDAIL